MIYSYQKLRYWIQWRIAERRFYKTLKKIEKGKRPTDIHDPELDKQLFDFRQKWGLYMWKLNEKTSKQQKNDYIDFP